MKIDKYVSFIEFKQIYESEVKIDDRIQTIIVRKLENICKETWTYLSKMYPIYQVEIESYTSFA